MSRWKRRLSNILVGIAMIPGWAKNLLGYTTSTSLSWGNPAKEDFMATESDWLQGMLAMAILCFVIGIIAGILNVTDIPPSALP